MEEKKLYIIAGCNGAGKTTASFTILPEILSCKEFVNADEIARGLSPFQPEKVAIQAGRLMLSRIEELLLWQENFAFETTLATKTYTNTIKKAQKKGYQVILLFFWLESVALAQKRVALRVKEGGHSIPCEVIERRYTSGIKNLFHLYLPLVDECYIFDNSKENYLSIAEKENDILTIHNQTLFNTIKKIADEYPS